MNEAPSFANEELKGFKIMQFIARILNKLRLLIRINFFTPLVCFKLWFWGAKVGKRLICRGNINIYNGGIIKIGDDVILSSGWQANPVGSFQNTTLQIQEGAILQIGNRCGISNTVIRCKTRIILEDDVFIGGGCSIYDSDFHPINAEDRLSKKNNISNKSIFIRQRVWIGGHCLILKGVTIGKDSVIGAEVS